MQDTILTDLQTTLSTLVVLAAKTRFYHWNLRGDLFFDLHAQFGDLYEYLNDIADDIAERIRTLGFVPTYNLIQHVDQSDVDMDVLADTEPHDMAKVTVMDLKRLLDVLRMLATNAPTLLDYGTENLVKREIEQVEKWSWKFRTFAENDPLPLQIVGSID